MYFFFSVKVIIKDASKVKLNAVRSAYFSRKVFMFKVLHKTTRVNMFVHPPGNGLLILQDEMLCSEALGIQVFGRCGQKTIPG